MKVKAFFPLFLLATLASLSLSAQGLMDKLADASCECISRQDVDNMTQEQLQPKAKEYFGRKEIREVEFL
ncbi:MAG: hypothetical protein J5I94_25880 [Phaeodactylibacter sp.]|nr:hypothetical protein [Phaeodactylibacter sp.]